MSRSSGRRGQVEPIAAIVAVFAVGAGLAIYAGVIDARLPGTTDRNVARPVLDRATATLGNASVVRPDRFGRVVTVVPAGYRVNATLQTADRRWQLGPPVPRRADTASRRLSVKLAPGVVRPGRLTVRVWS
jgi:hypothetical protein